MSRRSNRPALYELSTSSSPVDTGRREARARSEAEGQESSGTWLTPGTGIRIPGGFLVAAVLIAIALIAGGWWLGFQQGVARTEALMAQRPSQITVDPLVITDIDAPPPAPSQVLGPKQSENQVPRPKPGWHFVLAETSQAGAERLASFCRDQGLEVTVVPRHNTDLARIVALPAVPSSSRQDARVRELDQKIDVIGRRWKKRGGRTDFSDRYMDRISPPESAD